jgi:hypothetical protein
VAVAVAVVAVAVVAVGGAVVEAVARGEAPARVGVPKRMSPGAALRQASAWLSSHSRPPTTPQGARADRSCGRSTCHEVYGETPKFANRALPPGLVDEPSTDTRPRVVRHINRNRAYALVRGKQCR